MSNKKKKNPSKVISHKTGAVIEEKKPIEVTEEAKHEKKNIAKHSTIIFVFTAILVLVVFCGRWIHAISVGYYETFVQCGESVVTAASNMKGLELEEGEQAAQLAAEKEWDLYKSSRLCDEIRVSSSDGTVLHGYYINNQSTKTVIYIPRFAQDGTSDFLPGTWFAEQGYNLLLTDPRAHGESEGNAFGYGVLEQYDLRAWLDFAENTLGADDIVIWGEATGANTALFASANGCLDEHVRLIVAESAYSSLHKLASRNMLHWYTVPAFPFLYAIEMRVNRSDIGFRASDINLVKTLSGVETTVPVLFLESLEDDYVLLDWSKEVVEVYTGEKNEIAGGGTHGTVYVSRQEMIQEYISDIVK